MKLSLSVRIAESPAQKGATAIPIEQLAPLARACGYEAICLRASVVSIDSSPERVAAVRETLATNGLAVSMVTGDTQLAANLDERAVQAIRNITPYLDLAERLGCTLLRVMMHTEADIPWAQRAADEARERGIGLAHQIHLATLCETVDGALATIRAVNRPNFGITYEPANLLAMGQEWGAGVIERLAPHIVNAYFQNFVLDPEGPVMWAMVGRGWDRGRYLPLSDPSGVAVEPVVQGLKAIGYDGWFTIHQPLREGLTVEEAVKEAYRAVAPYLA
ncbi:MAG: sugar phosphate isomerase/epimerase [Chloroflexi bacterium]|nr:sugar phosphate isomerase/epimerase [Chloroflexota bacterium]